MEFGGSPKALEKWLEETVKKFAVGQRKKGRPAPKAGMDRARAERMAADLDDYDGQIVGGRLTGG